MLLQIEKTQELLSTIEQQFPDWQGFSDFRFEKEEVDYKQKAVQKAKELLKESDLLDLIVRGEFDQFIDRLITVAQTGKNLMYLSAPSQGDLSILYHDDLDKQAFCQAFVDLVHGSGSSSDRLDKYVKFVADNHYPNKWTFPTYFLFMCHPETEMYVKPYTTKWFFQFSGWGESWQARPSGEVYAKLLDLCHQLWDGVKVYQPRDYVDIQSIVWVAYSAHNRKKELGDPFNKMFKDWEQAEWVFDLLQFTAEKLGVTDVDDPLLATTCRYYPRGQRIHLSFGQWLTVGIYGESGQVTSLAFALLEGKLELNWMSKGTFAKAPEENPIGLYEVSYEDFLKNEREILDRFTETLPLIVDQFKDWKASPFHKSHQIELAKAIFDSDEREKILVNGIQIEQENDDTPTEGVIRYWKIAPGESGSYWDTCREGGFIAVGWNELGDIGRLSKDEFKARCESLLKEHTEWGSKGIEQVWDFIQLQEGDRVVANRGTKEVLGIGTVTGPYYYDSTAAYAHHIPVRWDDTALRPISKGHWVRTMIELGQKEFEEIQQLPSVPMAERFFDEETFELLGMIDKEPSMTVYNAHKQGFKTKIEQPFKDLLAQAITYLRPEIVDFMETERGLFSRFNKNDYGRGGAWNHYWGAIYPKGRKRTQDAQLFMWIYHEQFGFGFYLGEHGETAQNRLRRNCQENFDKLKHWMNDLMMDSSIIFGDHRDVTFGPDGSIIGYNGITLEDWLRDPAAAKYSINTVFQKEQVLKIPAEEMVELVSDLFNRLFPFILLATFDDPMERIADYLDIQDTPDIQPAYSLEQCAEETGAMLEELKKWVRAIERKKQAVLYGPPGTGKTFIAEKLARHLIGGGDGFSQLIQFHPEVSYEDFIQGIRPQPGKDGGLQYPVVPGRFMAFCKKASNRNGLCVLIIDEINRANLARVFGELMYLLEYRENEVELAAGHLFTIPSNVRIIGTMNTADRSIALVDHALRRRFAFLPLYPNYAILRKYHEREHTGFSVDGLIAVLEDLNKQIADKHYTIGPSYFLREDIASQIEDIWQMEIEPYLEEYFFDQPDHCKRFSWEKVSSKILK